MKQFYFLSGLPRSGSTLLSKILCQNPEIFCSSTSPLLDYIQQAASHLHDIKNNHSYGHIINTPLILNQTANSFFSFTNKPLIIDKNRSWINCVDAIKQDFTQEPKFIITLRPLDEVITSFYHILQKNNKTITPTRIYVEWVEPIYNNLIQFSKHKDICCVVTYKDLTNKTPRVLKKIESFLELKNFNYNLDDIRDDSPEDDEKWGISGLHSIRPTINIQHKDPKEILSVNQLEFCKIETEKLYKAFGLEIL